MGFLRIFFYVYCLILSFKKIKVRDLSQSESGINKRCEVAQSETERVAEPESAVCALKSLFISAAVIANSWLFVCNGGEIHSLHMFI